MVLRQMQLKVTTEWLGNLLNPRRFSRPMIQSEKSLLWVSRRSQRSGQCLFGIGHLRILSLQYSLRTGLLPDGWRRLCPRVPEVYPFEEYPVKMKKSSNISVTALHRFIPQPASGRSSELSLLSFCLCLAAILVLAKFLWEIHLHSLKFIPILSGRFNTNF